MKGLLQIGDLARLGGVSVKALRFYDEQGLLRPEHVDPQTGYRYYTLDQADLLAVITNLRVVDFSIAEIAALIGADDLGPETLRSAIGKKQDDLRRARDAAETKIRIADILARSAGTDAAAPPSLKLIPLEAQRVYCLRDQVPHLGDPVKDMFETAETRVGEHNARAPTAPFLIFHDPPTTEENLDVEVAIPVTDTAPEALPVTVLAGAGIACSVVYGGGYHKTDALFVQMTDWLHAAGLETAGPLREIYHRFGADQEDYRLPSRMTAGNWREFLTELQIPIRMKTDKKERE